MEPTDLTIEILKGIRDEIRATRTDLSERIDETNTRLHHLERCQVESETRLATELVAVASVVSGLRDDLRQDRALREQVHDHERRLRAIEARAE